MPCSTRCRGSLADLCNLLLLRLEQPMLQSSLVARNKHFDLQSTRQSTLTSSLVKLLQNVIRPNIRSIPKAAGFAGHAVKKGARPPNGQHQFYDSEVSRRQQSARQLTILGHSGHVPWLPTFKHVGPGLNRQHEFYDVQVSRCHQSPW